MSKRSPDRKQGGKKEVDKGQPRAAASAPKKQAVPKPAPPRKQVHSPDRYWYGAILAIMLFSLYLRVIIPWSRVFQGDVVMFSSESDAWYHMMLAKSTMLNLHRTFFDPLTYFPYGTSLHFGPFVSWGITILSYIVGLGRPSLHTVDVVGAYWPAIMGTLLILPVYSIGKEIGGRGCGLIAAITVAVLPGQLFSRTTLGFTDHHSTETLLSTLAMLFLMLALRSGRDLNLSTIRQIERTDVRRSLIFAALAGIFLGLYIDSWAMGILFEGIILIFVTIQAVIDHHRDRRTDYLGIILGIAFPLAFLTILPFANPQNKFSVIQYSLFQPMMLLLGAIWVVEIAALSRYLRGKKIGGAAGFPLSIVGVAVLDLALAFVISPGFISYLKGAIPFYLLPRAGGAATVQELSPLWYNNGIAGNFPGILNLVMANPPALLDIITTTFFFALVGIALLTLRYSKDLRASDLLVVVWSLIILGATLSANRSAYYFGVNVAILCGYFGIRFLELVHIDDLDGKVVAWTKEPKEMVKDVKVQHLAALIVVALLLVYPSLSMSNLMANSVGGPDRDWYNSIMWLGNNTPDPGLGIYEIYERPPEGEAFTYPDTAYGVMSWWDYGHLIETISGRYPNANPFQEGIGNKTAGVPGSSPFLLAESEEEAERVLSNLDLNRSPYMNTKYVMTDDSMALGKFHAIAAWSAIPYNRYSGAVYQPQGETIVPIQFWQEPYFQTIVARLHMFDGSEAPISDAVGIAYKAIEVQDGMSVPVMVSAPEISANLSELREFVNQSLGQGLTAAIVSRSPAAPCVPVEALQHYRLVHESGPVMNYYGHVKTFEHVPGVALTGKAPAGTRVFITAAIVTNFNRTFNYVQSTVSDGDYTLVVPYSTEGPVPEGTNFDVGPSGPYRLIVGETVYEIRIPEEMVLQGSAIEVS